MSRAIASPTLFKGEDMYLNTPDGDEIWSSRPLSRKEWRTLSWKFHEGSSGRSALRGWSISVGLVMTLIVAGLIDGITAFFVPVVIILAYLGIVTGIGGFVKDAKQRLQGDHQLRFPQMQAGTPGFDLASHYLYLLHMERTDFVATDVAVVLNKSNADAVIAEWLESRWLDDHFSVYPEIHDDSIDHAQFRLGATERAVDSFKQLDLPQLWAFEDFCANKLDKVRRAVKKELKGELKKQRRVADEARERVEWLQIELARVDRQIAYEQSGTY